MRRIRFFGLLLLALAAALALPACGKKGDPRPSQALRLPPIADLAADSGAEGIRLGWTVPRGQQGIGGFRIFRSDADAALACPGCPKEHRPLVDLPLNDPRLSRDGEAVRYTDVAVRPGRHYTYRVAVCDRAGRCGEWSNIAEPRHGTP